MAEYLRTAISHHGNNGDKLGQPGQVAPIQRQCREGADQGTGCSEEARGAENPVAEKHGDEG
jgi:hypothetical protein